MSSEDRYHTTSWEAPGQQPERRASAKPAANKKKKKRRKRGRRRTNPFLGFILWVVFVAVASGLLAAVGWNLANDLCAFNKTYKEVSVEVPEAWSLGTEIVTAEDGSAKEYEVVDMEKVATMLKDKGLIEYDWFFRIFSWVFHGERKVKAGSYDLNTDMDYRALIYGMIPGRKVTNAETVDVTIPEGYSVEQIIQLLAEKGVNTVEELTKAAEEEPFEEYGFIDSKHLGDISRLEGYLYPDTYNFYVGGKPEVALETMLKTFNSRIYADGDISVLVEESGYTMEEIMTIASLIEKETDGTDREKIASVITNRLENVGETAHFLQIDAALVYAAGREITQEDYAGLQSPYNLYLNPGLPPTPIANPGMASIKAALQPADTDYYFYVLGPDGKHIFNETLAGHQKTIAGLG